MITMIRFFWKKHHRGSGISEDVIARYDERLTDKWMSASPGMSGATEHHKLPLPLRAAFGQFEEIRKIGKKRSGGNRRAVRRSDFERKG